MIERYSEGWCKQWN